MKKRLGMPRMLSRAHIREESAQRDVAERERAKTANEEAYVVQLELLRNARDSQPGGVDAASFQRQRSQLAAGARAVDEAAEAAEAAEHELRMAQMRLFETARERRTLERLEDRDRSVLAVLASRAAQRALDDLAAKKREP
jgi:flagellar biosynthesis chaperone FliJ